MGNLHHRQAGCSDPAEKGSTTKKKSKQCACPAKSPERGEEARDVSRGALKGVGPVLGVDLGSLWPGSSSAEAFTSSMGLLTPKEVIRLAVKFLRFIPHAAQGGLW